mgnify:CR=1 FL=1
MRRQTATNARVTPNAIVQPSAIDELFPLDVYVISQEWPNSCAMSEDGEPFIFPSRDAAETMLREMRYTWGLEDPDSWQILKVRMTKRTKERTSDRRLVGWITSSVQTLREWSEGKDFYLFDMSGEDFGRGQVYALQLMPDKTTALRWSDWCKECMRSDIKEDVCALGPGKIEERLASDPPSPIPVCIELMGAPPAPSARTLLSKTKEGLRLLLALEEADRDKYDHRVVMSLLSEVLTGRTRRICKRLRAERQGPDLDIIALAQQVHAQNPTMSQPDAVRRVLLENPQLAVQFARHARYDIVR